MALRKCNPAPDVSMASLMSKRVHEREHPSDPKITVGTLMETDVDIDLREVYFLIIHFLSSGPCRRTYAQFWNELLEHQLLPRRYHAWYSRSGKPSGDENDNGNSLPLNYSSLLERYPHIEQHHLVKLLKQLLSTCSRPSHGLVGGSFPNAADVPTLLGSGSFSLLGSNRDIEDQKASELPGHLRWPHIHADQVRGLSLREIGGGFSKHHRAASVRAACYAIAKPSTVLQKMEVKKRLRGHRNAVYCAIFDRSGRYVITGSDDRLVKIWSMETAFCLASCRGHEGDITDLAVSSNNALVASASNDFIIRVWRLPDGLPISVLRGHTGAVTAIAFSPRPTAVYQLLSSSDDGTCRIWDARYSQTSPRVYVPKPPDVIPGKSSHPSSSAGPQGHQILCCAYNANGTVFVTGSSDTYARVWNAWKTNPEDAEQPCHEMDLLSGHENDVNYVQFSGCAVPSRSSAADTSKEDNLPKFKNSWFTHDNIVTCSRDGSAIIWIPRSRRSHGKVGRWTRAYHLKVPPPPAPPQPPRGGPRQRFHPTPRGVNMIVWSLDNRFVLAAIMDCRICVWNASDGSLVHSLIGHSESTFVLDVHPFNPRIAMSAGYDGRTIIWDIWEGTPVRIYETGRFKLVDGKFSPDGTSIVLSDEVGQIFIIATGQGDSHEDAKYDQFFLGDYRPLIQDTHGNVLDQETQLPPHRRNMQDLLCDSSMIPYPEPYQSMYQRHRLGALGIEWHPPSVKFAVGPADNINAGDHQIPLIDLDRWVEPIPEFLDAMDWEQENEVQTDDTDSEYDATEEFSTEGDQGSVSISSSGDSECSAEESEVNHGSKEGLRRSKRKTQKAEAELTTSSGRRVKRRNLDERDGTISKNRRTRRTRNGKFSRRKSSKSLRPQRRAARNALTLFSQINGASTDGENEDVSETDPSDSESMLRDSNTQSNESDHSSSKAQAKHTKQKDIATNECDDVSKASQVTNSLNKRRLVLKLPVRDRKETHPENTRSEYHEQEDKTLLAKKLSGGTILNGHYAGSCEKAQSSRHAIDAISGENGSSGKTKERWHIERFIDHSDLSSGYKGGTIKWGEVKTRSTKRLRLSEAPAIDVRHVESSSVVPKILGNGANGHLKSEDQHGLPSSSGNKVCGESLYRKDDNEQSTCGVSEGFMSSRIGAGPGLENESKCLSQDVDTSRRVSPVTCNGHGNAIQLFNGEDLCGTETNDDVKKPLEQATSANDFVNCQVDKKPVYRRLKIKSSGLTNEPGSPSSKLKSVAVDDWNSECDLMSEGPMKPEWNSVAREADEGTSGHSQHNSDWNDGSGILEGWEGKTARLSISQDWKGSCVDSYSKKYNAVYKRSNSSRGRKSFQGDANHIEESTSNHDYYSAFTDATVCEARSVGVNKTSNLSHSVANVSRVAETHSTAEISKARGKPALNGCEQFLCDEWKSTSKMTVGLRSQRNRRENYSACDLSLGEGRNQHPTKKMSWLLLSEHEEGYRYIPQMGDEIVYLRQGHEEYLKSSHSREVGPWKLVKVGSLKAVEFCRVQALEYSTLPGSGESCCKLTLKFIDPSSCAFHKAFTLTLPELVAIPDFIVERTRYDAAIERNWTVRDKCQVWWRNEDGEGGSWWEGRIVGVKAKSPEFLDSPWERYAVQYKNDTSQLHHSPWELHDCDSQWEHPHIDETSRDMLLSSLDKLEQFSLRNRDLIERLNEVALKPEFINRFPVPLSPEMIESRLENNYYRNLDAVKHDVSVMVTNATSHWGKKKELSLKIRRLSDSLTDILSSL